MEHLIDSTTCLDVHIFATQKSVAVLKFYNSESKLVLEESDALACSILVIIKVG